MSLTYLLASLPYLTLDTPPTISPAAFLSVCREQLDVPVVAAITALLDNRPDDHPFVRTWHDKETLLRNAVVRQRAIRLNVEPTLWLRPSTDCNLYIEHAVEAAFQLTDPLIRERALDRLRWSMVDELQGFDTLSTSTILAYAIRLRLSTRWSQMQTETGRKEANSLTDIPLEIAS